MPEHVPRQNELNRFNLDLIAELVSPRVQRELHKRSVLPVRSDALDIVRSSGWPFADIFVKSLETGRALPSMPLWGLTEQRLAETFNRIFDELSEQSKPDVDAVLSRHLLPLVDRLNYILGG